ncbi:MAG: hypothetical protein A3G33_04230 [Omnitrophica bacterium RIFCSPLOWO2_12_FULL_44_17]|uniref:Plasmid stabilization protein n=1 Tax=Candidatus Danuiimicrobium aquiferis TaxID=1801832 RepID=A0A1G1KQN9_9BACT|nr:MAG: hypothetical protein A3B72_10435 [Omnitrophica bacterium RIFCSPHIGHO2_02_FULL_45_28]OGW89542.1 MAG: hypothetical protein A3E74_07965 [Omnitrophica bacterium RIFCSPHIGHO2_12_FULL_44_12]OGW95145.1 MAG: hypothetical protein A3G33_04230 [Omnitrophica bacterium RIFCSPLOWO2_12_FULL_44_17]OGX01711.1 MAG: hypothetical protein A3J12_04210 [Omnitrophica bacterium RIFCSPLOWO2_02_FULL_44_11]
MKKYQVYLTRTAQKDYDRIRDEKLRRGVNRVIEKIQEDPYQFKRLTGPLSYLHSAKTFSFRVLYQIHDKKLIIFVISIEHRKNVYRY